VENHYKVVSKYDKEIISNLLTERTVNTNESLKKAKIEVNNQKQLLQQSSNNKKTIEDLTKKIKEAESKVIDAENKAKIEAQEKMKIIQEQEENKAKQAQEELQKTKAQEENKIKEENIAKQAQEELRKKQAQTQAQVQLSQNNNLQSINKMSYGNIPSMSVPTNIYGGPANLNLDLDKKIPRTDNNITPELANFNFALGQIHLKDQKEWSRDENGILQRYIKKDGKYEKQPVLTLDDMCLRDANTSIDTTKCLQFLNSAGLKKDSYKNAFLDGLKDYIGGNSINKFDTTTLAKALGNVHPNLAAHVLLNFGFKRVTEKNPNTGLVTDTLQDIKSWLRDLSNDKIATSKFGDDANVKALRDAVGLNGNFDVPAQNILTYFHILREWVTANPGVLNDEFVWKNPTDIKLDEPAPNDKFKLYAYKSPQLKIALSKVNDNLSRLKTTILKYGGTFNPEKTLNDTIKTPWPLHAPLNPYAYAFPHSPLNPQMFMGQAGGDASAIQAELEKNGLSGAKLLKEAYNSIVGILKVDPINKTVSDHTDTEMNDRLKKLEEAEASVYQSMNNLVDRYRLYIASKGQIDVLRVQDDDLPALMKKHTELFNKTQSYTKKCTNIITCLQKLADIAEKALEKESQ
jgi:hypothetical protein